MFFFSREYVQQDYEDWKEQFHNNLQSSLSSDPETKYHEEYFSAIGRHLDLIFLNIHDPIWKQV